MTHGYAVSPIAWKNTVIVKLGEQGQAIVALNPKDGSLVWQKQDFLYTPSTPIVINVDGQDQLATTFKGVIAGFDPDNGELLWSQPPPGGPIRSRQIEHPGLDHQHTNLGTRQPAIHEFGGKWCREGASLDPVRRED